MAYLWHNRGVRLFTSVRLMFSILAGEKKRDEVERVIKGGVMALSTRLPLPQGPTSPEGNTQRVDGFRIRLRSIIFD